MARKEAIPVFFKTDKRLIGTWKSDRERTFREWVWPRKLSPQKKHRFKALFGKLEIKYTRSRIIWTLPQRRSQQSRRYVVVASDDTSVAVVQFGKTEIKSRRKYDPENLKLAEMLFPVRPRIQHIHFDENYFWISLGNGRNREFFRKIPAGKARKK